MNRIIKNLNTYLLLIIVTFHTSINAQVVFNEHSIDDNVGGNGCIYGCDIDGDSDIDLLTANIEDNAIYMYRNDGGNPIVWTKFTVDNLVYGARSVHANDVDGDGDCDIIGASYVGTRAVLWWRNDGGDPLQWTRFEISQTFRNAHEVFSIDIDNDSDIDILGASSDQKMIALWRNDGGDPITWTRQTISDIENLAKSVHAGDIDGDGDIDIVGATLGLSDVVWWRNDGGDPIAWTKYLVDGYFTGAHRVEAVDINQDGNLDVLAAGYTGNKIAWWRNDGGDPITWTKQEIATNFYDACVATVKDIDNDGDLDIIGTGQGIPQIALWENLGGDPINWSKYVISDNFTRPWPLFINDFDNDYDNDIAVSSSHNGNRKVHWWENTLPLGVLNENKNNNTFVLNQNFPNPFNPTTKINYSLLQDSNVSLDIFDASGKHVITLINGNMHKGEYSINWNGTDENGSKLGAGLYIYQMKTDNFTKNNKMLLIN